MNPERMSFSSSLGESYHGRMLKVVQTPIQTRFKRILASQQTKLNGVLAISDNLPLVTQLPLTQSTSYPSVDSTLNRRRKSVEKRKNISTVVEKALKFRRRINVEILTVPTGITTHEGGVKMEKQKLCLINYR